MKLFCNLVHAVKSGYEIICFGDVFETNGRRKPRLLGPRDPKQIDRDERQREAQKLGKNIYDHCDFYSALVVAMVCQKLFHRIIQRINYLSSQFEI